MTEEEQPFWISFKINLATFKFPNARERIEKELDKIFGEDLCDHKLVENFMSNEDAELYEYGFAKIKKYSHSFEIKSSNVIHMALGTLGKPEIVPDEQVYRFSKNINDDISKPKYEGDLVVVKTGILKGLSAIIHKIIAPQKYRLFFRFNSKCFFEDMSDRDFEVKASVSSQWKFPVKYEKKPVFLRLLPNKEPKCQKQKRK